MEIIEPQHFVFIGAVVNLLLWFQVGVNCGGGWCDVIVMILLERLRIVDEDAIC